jgi:beta-galactosidase
MSLRADGQDCAQLNVRVVDSKGIDVPTANDLITFTVQGPGHIIGVGNGDPSCHEPDKAAKRSAFMGLAAGFLQTSKTAGEIRVKVAAKGLESAEIVLPSQQA